MFFCGWKGLVGRRGVTGTAFLCLVTGDMDICVTGFATVSGMNAGGMLTSRLGVAGCAIGPFQFFGMGQVLRVVVTDKTINAAMICLFVFFMTIKTFVGGKHAKRKEHANNKGKTAERIHPGTILNNTPPP